MSNVKRIELPPRGLETLFGVHDANIKFLESVLDVRVNARGQDLTVDGDPKDVETVEQILKDFGELFSEGNTFTDKELLEQLGELGMSKRHNRQLGGRMPQGGFPLIRPENLHALTQHHERLVDIPCLFEPLPCILSVLCAL